MLSSIFDILKSIGDFFSMLIDIVIDLFTGLVDFMKTLATVPALFSSVLGGSGLPVVITSGIIGVVAVVIILRIIGRD